MVRLFLSNVALLFCAGIPYLNLAEESKYKENLDEAQKIRANNLSGESQQNRIPIPKEDAPFVKQILYNYSVKQRISF